MLTPGKFIAIIYCVWQNIQGVIGQAGPQAFIRVFIIDPWVLVLLEIFLHKSQVGQDKWQSKIPVRRVQINSVSHGFLAEASIYCSKLRVQLYPA